jgi:hypothetical protein
VDTQTTPPTVSNTLTMPAGAGTIPATGVADANGVLVRCQEVSNGDMNGDLDTSDTFFCFFSWAAPTTRVRLGNAGGDHGRPGGGVIGVTANEALGGADLNGDLDANDFVFMAFDAAGQAVGGPILSAAQSVPATDSGTVWAFLRNEVAEARVMNGDGDSADLLMGIWLKP